MGGVAAAGESLHTVGGLAPGGDAAAVQGVVLDPVAAGVGGPEFTEGAQGHIEIGAGDDEARRVQVGILLTDLPFERAI